MPRTNTQRIRRQLEQSIEREKQWQARLAETEEALKISNEVAVAENRSAAAHMGELSAENNLLRRQGWHVRQTLDAMFQRYIGVRLEAQSFNIDQANAWIASERSAIEAGLEAIRQEVDREQSAASNGEGWTAEYVATVAEGAEAKR